MTKPGLGKFVRAECLLTLGGSWKEVSNINGNFFCLSLSMLYFSSFSRRGSPRVLKLYMQF